jgi:hypothetical protein
MQLGLAKTVFIHRIWPYIRISLPKIPYIHRIYKVRASPTHVHFLFSKKTTSNCSKQSSSSVVRWLVRQVGQNRIYAPYMTVHLVILVASLLKTPCIVLPACISNLQLAHVALPACISNLQLAHVVLPACIYNLPLAHVVQPACISNLPLAHVVQPACISNLQLAHVALPACISPSQRASGMLPACILFVQAGSTTFCRCNETDASRYIGLARIVYYIIHTVHDRMCGISLLQKPYIHRTYECTYSFGQPCRYT